jgi:hypothetical protein
VSELCARRRVGPDATGIIIDVCGDETRADYGEEQQDPGLPASQELHEHISQTWEQPTTRQNKCGTGIWIVENFQFSIFHHDLCRNAFVQLQ